MKKLITLFLMACLTTAGFAFLPYDVSVTQRDATNTKFNTIYIGASGAITDTASFRSTLGIPGLAVANTWTASQTYSGTGLRLIGDLSNATHANRLLWQTSTSNGNSLIGVLPNGTAKVAGFNAYGSSDPDNSSQLQLISDQTNSLNRINSKKTGTGTTLPVAIQFDDVTYVKFGTNGLTTIIANTTDPGTSGATDTLLHLVQADNVSARILGDSASNVGLVLTGRMSGGTMASPSATPALNDMLVMAGRGYANGAYTTTKAFIKLTALNTWTASDNSTFFTISLTPSGSTTVGDYFVLKSDNLNIPITTSASSSTTGSVTIGNGTAATNVGIGGGNIYTGGLVSTTDINVSGTMTFTGGSPLSFSAANGATFSSSGANGYTFSAPLNFSGTTNTGLQVNNLTTTQKNALTAVAGGLVYDTTLTRMSAYENAGWHSYVRLDGDTFGGTMTSTFPINIGGVTSTTAFTVGRSSGTTNPAFQVNTSTGSSVTGISVESGTSGNGVTLRVISSGATDGVSITSKGGSTITLGNGNGQYAKFSDSFTTIGPPSVRNAIVTPTWKFTSKADTALTAGTEAPIMQVDMNQTHQHASNTTIATQRDVLVNAATHSFASAGGTITTAATHAVTGAPIAGTNATITNAYSYWAQGGVAAFDGGILVGQGTTLSKIRRGTAVLVAGTATVSDSSITANSEIYVGMKTPGGTPGACFISAKTASTSFAITSTSASDTSTVSYLIIEP